MNDLLKQILNTLFADVRRAATGATTGAVAANKVFKDTPAQALVTKGTWPHIYVYFSGSERLPEGGTLKGSRYRFSFGVDIFDRSQDAIPVLFGPIQEGVLANQRRYVVDDSGNSSGDPLAVTTELALTEIQQVAEKLSDGVAFRMTFDVITDVENP